MKTKYLICTEIEIEHDDNFTSAELYEHARNSIEIDVGAELIRQEITEMPDTFNNKWDDML